MLLQESHHVALTSPSAFIFKVKSVKAISRYTCTCVNIILLQATLGTPKKCSG